MPPKTASKSQIDFAVDILGLVCHQLHCDVGVGVGAQDLPGIQAYGQERLLPQESCSGTNLLQWLRKQLKFLARF